MRRRAWQSERVAAGADGTGYPAQSDAFDLLSRAFTTAHVTTQVRQVDAAAGSGAVDGDHRALRKADRGIAGVADAGTMF